MSAYDEDLESAVFYDNKAFVLGWLENLTDRACREKRGDVLRKASHLHSVEVIQCLLSSGDFSDVINSADSAGKTPLHLAAEGHNHDTKPNNINDPLKTITLLYQYGGDPVVKCKEGATPKDIAVTTDFRLGAALIEILEGMWTEQCSFASTLDYKEIVPLQQNILEWAINQQLSDLVQFMLTGNPHHAMVKLLRNTELNGKTLFHVAVWVGNAQILKMLIASGGLPLNTIANKRWDQIVTDTTQNYYITPLSLVFSHASSSELTDVFVKQQSKGDYLTHISLSGMDVILLPKELFRFSYLTNLNVSHNKLTSLPSEMSSALLPQHLKELDLSHNLLISIPIQLFGLPSLQKLDVSNNPLTSLPSKWWLSKSLVHLNVSQTQLRELFDPDQVLSPTIKVTSTSFAKSYRLRSRTEILREFEDPMVFLNQYDGMSLLHYLDVSHCHLIEFPDCLACCFPNLNNLNFSGNNITSCCAINELPAMLEELDISYNKLQPDICTFTLSAEKDEVPCQRDANVTSCHHMKHNKLQKLTVLNLAGNEEIKEVVLHAAAMDRSISANLFFPKLRKLNLSHCMLEHCPEHLFKMTDLFNLNINHNNFRIPQQICNMENLRIFTYDGLKDPVVSDLNKFATVKEIQMFLRQRNACGVPSVKLMFVGYSGHGKTSLLNHMINAGKRQAQDEVKPTVGITLRKAWIYTPRPSVDPAITFYSWDFSGQVRFLASHECFLASRAIYVLCWKASDGEAGILHLKEVLLVIKARAKYAAVVIVGTHIDLVDHFNKKKPLFEQKIGQLYFNRFYPDIKAICFVTCKGKHKSTIPKLCTKLYEVAASLEIPLGVKNFTQKLITMKIPDSYYRLQGGILAAAHSKSSRTPILSEEEIRRLGLQYGLDESETAVAVAYIKEHGSLIHFESAELRDFYFINPQWLSDVFTHVILLPNEFTNIEDGKIRKAVVEKSLSKRFNISPEIMEPIFALLQKFELAIPLSISVLLIPSFLQNKEPKKLFSIEQYNFPRRKRFSSCKFDDHLATKHSRNDKVRFSVLEMMSVDLRSTGMCFRRFFFADRIPPNIWLKLTARFLLSVHQNSFHKIICDNCVSGVPYKLTSSAGDALIGNLLCKWSYGKNYIELSLGEYVLLRVNAFQSYNSEESKHITISATKKKLETMLVHKQNSKTAEDSMLDREGFEVNIPDYIIISRNSEDSTDFQSSNLFSMQILSHVLEIIDEVLRDWFEGLSEEGIYSDKHLSHIVPCPHCCGDETIEEEEINGSDQNDVFPNDQNGHHSCVAFAIQFLLQQMNKSDSVVCSHHGKLKIKDLAPDVVFDDIAVEKIDDTKLELEQQLGKGGFGVVQKMKLLTDPVQHVAVKCCTGNLWTEDCDDELIQIYADIRQELNKLISLDHPNIVNCIGFCLSSLSFVLEWASFGSMTNVLDNYKLCGYVLCPESVVNILKQASQALVYLHNKAIVHYDIKPDNILVFSFPQAGHDCFNKDESISCKACQNDGVLVKLADLGISALAGPGGFHRKPATPGHTAPEALRCAGREPLGEKVDIFSLGITLYEMMTLQALPPPNLQSFEFDWDIESGLRPPLFTDGSNPKYPIILKELVVNCWAQEYAARPTAQEIVSILQSPDCLKLTNTYNTELPYSVVSAALVVTVGNQQSLWLAHTTDNRCSVTVYKFVEHINIMATPIEINVSVQAMCQVGGHIWMTSPQGHLIVVDAVTHNIRQQIDRPELVKDDIIDMKTIQAGLLTIVYKSGLVVFVSTSSPKRCANHKPQSFLRTLSPKGAIGQNQPNLSSITVTSPELYATDVHTSQGDRITEVWCGCGNGVIEVITPPDGDCKPESSLVLNTHHSSADIPPDASIIQLKSSLHAPSNTTYVYALHDTESVISCWRVGERPTLSSVIRLSPHINSPATAILPLKDHLFVADSEGSVHRINLADSNDDPSCQLLVGHHQSNMQVQMFALHGQMDTKGFLSDIGSVGEGVDERLTCSSIPCDVLLSMGAGYLNTFHNDETVNPRPPLHFTTWTIL